MIHIKDLSGTGAVFGNPLTVLAITSEYGDGSGSSTIHVAEGGVIVSRSVHQRTAKDVALHIDGLIDEALTEEEESDYDNREEFDGDE